MRLGVYLKRWLEMIVKDPRRQAIATDIVELCAGLPVVICTVGKALRSKKLFAWKDALKRLKSFDKEGIHQIVYKAVKLSYNSLKSEEKSLFLLIALQGRNHSHKYDLLIFSMGLGMFKDVETLQDARNRLNRLTDDLMDKSLLTEDDKSYVVVHDLVLEAAVSLATEDQTAFTWKAFTELKNWPERDRLYKCKQIFFTWCYLPPLPEKLESPELQILALDNATVLDYEGSYLQMPDSFFEKTRNLKALDISGMDCTPKLPMSLGLLKNLTSLFLYHCKLKDIAMLGELTNLQILNLSRPTIRELPREIGELHQLRLLDLDPCYLLEVIPHSVISKLTSLEELHTGNFANWKVEVEGKMNASLNELEKLKHHLRAIDLNIPDAEAWPVDLFFENLDSFRIFIGDVWSWDKDVYRSIYESKMLKLKLNRSIQSEHGIKMMLKQVDDLSLHELNDVKDVLYDLNGDGFPLLNHLTIQNNGEIESIAASSSCPLYAFPNLETLSLYNLSNLEHICHGFLTEESFCKLRVIKVEECHKLKCLITCSMSKAFSSLAEIEVSECSLLETVVLSGGVEFSEMHSLRMEGLPALIRFSPGETEQIYDGDNLSSFLVPLFNEKVSFPKLETLIISKVVGAMTIWNRKVIANSFCKLRSVEINYCEKLVTTFPTSIVRNLHDLENLTVSNCNSLEVIFELQEPNDEISSTGKRIQLESLILVKLPKLKQIWNNTYLQGTFNFENLKEVYIEDCPMLNYVFPSSLANDLLQVKDLITIQNSPTTYPFEQKGGN